MPNAYYWICLAGSILLEVTGTSIMKYSQQSWPVQGMALMYLCIAVSYLLLAKAIVRLPVGVAYAFWEGIGLALITLVSFVLLQEHMDALRLTALTMVLAGTFLVHHGTESHPQEDRPADEGEIGKGRSR